jgi:hypothetical protein
MSMAVATPEVTPPPRARRDSPLDATRPLHAARIAAVSVPRPAARRAIPWFGAWLNRPRRVLLTLAAVWIIGVFDFVFTLLEFGTHGFVELNPLAARLLAGPDYVVAVFKFGLLGFGTVILLALRRRAITELACWLLLGTKVYVAIRWYMYYVFLMDSSSNPFITSG